MNAEKAKKIINATVNAQAAAEEAALKLGNDVLNGILNEKMSVNDIIRKIAEVASATAILEFAKGLEK